MKFYGYKKCDSCRKAMKWLDAEGVDYTFIDITQTPPSVAELRAVLASGFALKALFNRSGGQYRELDMKTRLPGMSEGEALALLAGNGYLVKRPIALAQASEEAKALATVGYKEADYARIWG